jgi:hypothetical protein
VTELVLQNATTTIRQPGKCKDFATEFEGDILGIETWKGNRAHIVDMP